MAKSKGYEIPIDIDLGGARKQLKAFRSELLTATDPDRIKYLSEAMGVLSDKFDEINEKAQVFTSGSKFEQAGNALGLVGSQLANLDFEGAAGSALLLQDRINSITPEEITKQMEGLTQTFSTLGKVGGKAIVGLIKNVGTMARAFMAFGAQLLANPIFLFAMVIVAIVAAIALLLNKLGLLKPIMEAIGKVFEWIGEVIDAVVQAIKDFLDWIGLTDFAAEDSARRQTEAAEKKADAYEKASKSITQSLDHEIKMNQINGKSTTALELEKQRVIRKTAQLRLDALKAKYRENMLTKEMDEEELKALHEKIDAQRELIRTSNYEMIEIREKAKVDAKKKRDEEAKEEAKEAKDHAKEAAEKAKKYRADRLAAERQYRDLELELMKDGEAKELAISDEKYKRLIEDTKRSESLLGAEKKRLIDLYTQQANESRKVIQDDYDQQEKESRLNHEKELAEIALYQDERNLEKRFALLDAEEAVELAQKELTESQKAAIERNYREQREAINQEERDRKAQEITDELERMDQLAELALLKNENDLELQKAKLDTEMQIELNNAELTETEKELIQERYRKRREELDEASAERRKQIEAQVASAAQQGLEGLMALNDLVYSIKSKKLQKGSEEEQKAAKKNFEINKKIQIAQAIIQGVQATLAAYSSGAAVPVVGVVLGPVFAALAAAAAIANVNKIKSQTFDGGGGGGGGSTGGGGGSSAMAAASTAPQFNLSGKPNTENNVSGGEKVQTLNVTLENKISETEITGTQNQIVKLEKSATLKNG